MVEVDLPTGRSWLTEYRLRCVDHVTTCQPHTGLVGLFWVRLVVLLSALALQPLRISALQR